MDTLQFYIGCTGRSYPRTGYLVRCIRSEFILVVFYTKIENSGTFKKESSTMNGGRA